MIIRSWLYQGRVEPVIVPAAETVPQPEQWSPAVSQPVPVQKRLLAAGAVGLLEPLRANFLDLPEIGWLQNGPTVVAGDRRAPQESHVHFAPVSPGETATSPSGVDWMFWGPDPIRASRWLPPVESLGVDDPSLLAGPTADSWYPSLEQPCRCQINSGPHQTRMELVDPQDLYAELVTLDRWWQPLSEPLSTAPLVLEGWQTEFFPISASVPDLEYWFQPIVQLPTRLGGSGPPEVLWRIFEPIPPEDAGEGLFWKGVENDLVIMDPAGDWEGNLFDRN